MTYRIVISYKIGSQTLISGLKVIQLLIKFIRKNIFLTQFITEHFSQYTYLFFNMATISNSGTTKQKPRLDLNGYSYARNGLSKRKLYMYTVLWANELIFSWWYRKLPSFYSSPKSLTTSLKSTIIHWKEKKSHFWQR